MKISLTVLVPAIMAALLIIANITPVFIMFYYSNHLIEHELQNLVVNLRGSVQTQVERQFSRKECNGQTIRNWTRINGIPYDSDINLRAYYSLSLGQLLASHRFTREYHLRRFDDGSLDESAAFDKDLNFFQLCQSDGIRNQSNRNERRTEELFNCKLALFNTKTGDLTSPATYKRENYNEWFVNSTIWNIFDNFLRVSGKYRYVNPTFNYHSGSDTKVGLLIGIGEYKQTPTIMLNNNITISPERHYVVPPWKQQLTGLFANEALQIDSLHQVLKDALPSVSTFEGTAAGDAPPPLAFLVDRNGLVIASSQFEKEKEYYSIVGLGLTDDPNHPSHKTFPGNDSRRIHDVPVDYRIPRANALNELDGRHCILDSLSGLNVGDAEFACCFHQINSYPKYSLLKSVNAFDLAGDFTSSAARTANGGTHDDEPVVDATTGKAYVWAFSRVSFSPDVQFSLFIFFPEDLVKGGVQQASFISRAYLATLTVVGALLIFLMIRPVVQVIEELAEKMARDPFDDEAHLDNSSSINNNNNHSDERSSSPSATAVKSPSSMSLSNTSSSKSANNNNSKNNKNRNSSIDCDDQDEDDELEREAKSSRGSYCCCSASACWSVFRDFFLHCPRVKNYVSESTWEVAELRSSFLELRAVIEQLRGFMPDRQHANGIDSSNSSIVGGQQQTNSSGRKNSHNINMKLFQTKKSKDAVRAALDRINAQYENDNNNNNVGNDNDDDDFVDDERDDDVMSNNKRQQKRHTRGASSSESEEENHAPSSTAEDNNINSSPTLNEESSSSSQQQHDTNNNNSSISPTPGSGGSSNNKLMNGSNVGIIVTPQESLNGGKNSTSSVTSPNVNQGQQFLTHQHAHQSSETIYINVNHNNGSNNNNFAASSSSSTGLNNSNNNSSPHHLSFNADSSHHHHHHNHSADFQDSAVLSEFATAAVSGSIKDDDNHHRHQDEVAASGSDRDRGNNNGLKSSLRKDSSSSGALLVNSSNDINNNNNNNNNNSSINQTNNDIINRNDNNHSPPPVLENCSFTSQSSASQQQKKVVRFKIEGDANNNTTSNTHSIRSPPLSPDGSGTALGHNNTNHNNSSDDAATSVSTPSPPPPHSSLYNQHDLNTSNTSSNSSSENNENNDDDDRPLIIQRSQVGRDGKISMMMTNPNSKTASDAVAVPIPHSLFLSSLAQQQHSQGISNNLNSLPSATTTPAMMKQTTSTSGRFLIAFINFRLLSTTDTKELFDSSSSTCCVNLYHKNNPNDNPSHYFCGSSNSKRNNNNNNNNNTSNNSTTDSSVSVAHQIHHQVMIEELKFVVDKMYQDIILPHGCHLIEYRNNQFVIALKLARKNNKRSGGRSRLACRFVQSLMALSEELYDKRRDFIDEQVKEAATKLEEQAQNQNNNNNTNNHSPSAAAAAATAPASSSSSSASFEQLREAVTNLERRNPATLTAGLSIGDVRILNLDDRVVMTSNNNIPSSSPNSPFTPTSPHYYNNQMMKEENYTNNSTIYNDVFNNNNNQDNIMYNSSNVTLRPLTLIGEAVAEAAECERYIRMSISESYEREMQRKRFEMMQQNKKKKQRQQKQKRSSSNCSTSGGYGNDNNNNNNERENYHHNHFSSSSPFSRMLSLTHAICYMDSINNLETLQMKNYVVGQSEKYYRNRARQQRHKKKLLAKVVAPTTSTTSQNSSRISSESITVNGSKEYHQHERHHHEIVFGHDEDDDIDDFDDDVNNGNDDFVQHFDESILDGGMEDGPPLACNNTLRPIVMEEENNNNVQEDNTNKDDNDCNETPPIVVQFNPSNNNNSDHNDDDLDAAFDRFCGSNAKNTNNKKKNNNSNSGSGTNGKNTNNGNNRGGRRRSSSKNRNGKNNRGSSFTSSYASRLDDQFIRIFSPNHFTTMLTERHVVPLPSVDADSSNSNILVHANNSTTSESVATNNNNNNDDNSSSITSTSQQQQDRKNNKKRRKRNSLDIDLPMEDEAVIRQKTTRRIIARQDKIHQHQLFQRLSFSDANSSNNLDASSMLMMSTMMTSEEIANAMEMYRKILRKERHAVEELIKEEQYVTNMQLYYEQEQQRYPEQNPESDDDEDS